MYSFENILQAKKRAHNTSNPHKSATCQSKTHYTSNFASIFLSKVR